MVSLTHIAIHHDPDGRCNDQLARHVEDLKSLFADSFVVLTRETAQKNHQTMELLESTGLASTTRSSVRGRQLDTARNIALVAGLTRGKGDLIFFGCLDRTLHWLDTYSQEMKEVLANGLLASDFLIVGRTERAFNTHPQSQRDPEAYTNRVTAEILGIEVDVAAGCAILTRETGKVILEYFKKNHKFTNREIDIDDSLWPIVAHLNGKKVGYLPVEGQEFETPDQYREEIDEMGYDEWIRRNFTEENLARRWERAYTTEIRIKEFASAIENPDKERA